jgi:mevalonyl-CoA ligase
MSPQPAPGLSIVSGPRTPTLCEKTLGEIIEEQAVQYGDAEAVVVPWQARRLSYRDLAERSKLVAKALLRFGLQPGDRIGIMAGNCYQYLELFLGAARVRCPAVVINNTFGPDELKRSISEVGE